VTEGGCYYDRIVSVIPDLPYDLTQLSHRRLTRRITSSHRAFTPLSTDPGNTYFKERARTEGRRAPAAGKSFADYCWRSALTM
jgi:hypothetical protein